MYGQVLESNKSARLVDKGSLTFTFTNMMIDNQMKSIATSDVKAVISASGSKTVITTARTAATRFLHHGSKGAKVGLDVSLLSSGNIVHVPFDTMLEFNSQKILKP